MFKNTFVKSIIFPILLTLISTLIEYLVQVYKGKSKGEKIYKVWINEPITTPSSGTTSSTSNPKFNIFQYTPRSIDFLYSRKDFIHIEPLISLELSNFGSVAINLIIGAFSIDIGYLFESKSIQSNIAWILLIQLFALPSILGLLALNNLSEPLIYPEQNDVELKRRNQKLRSSKNFLVLIAIGLGIFSMVITLYGTSGGVGSEG